MKYFKCERCGTHYQEGDRRCCVWRQSVEITEDEFVIETMRLLARWLPIKMVEMQQSQ